MSRFLLISILLSISVSASAEEGESRATLIGGAVFPMITSQSSTDFVLSTWSVGGGVDRGITDNIRLGARLTYLQFEASAEVEGDVGGAVFVDALDFRASAWAPQLYTVLDLLPGYIVRPQLLLAGGYTWMIYDELVQNGDQINEAPDDFAEGSFTVSAGLHFQVRPLDELTITAGAEYTHHLDGLWQGGIYFPVTASYVFWSN